jgi:putative membrane protein
MIRSARWLFVAALLPIAACSSNSATPVSAAPPALPPLAAADQAFINTAAQTDAAEIQGAQLALTKGRGKPVKTFAQKMIDDHTKADQQLMTIAQSKGFTPDATPPKMDMDMMAKLTADRPVAFNRDYLHGQVMGHQMAVKAFQDEIANGQDPDVKAYASATLPTVQMHLTMARRLSGMRG